MVNDPIGDMLIQIKNGSLAGKGEIILPFSRLKLEVARILKNEGYISLVDKVGDEPKSKLKIVLRYDNGNPVIGDVSRKSKPGMRVYVGKDDIPTVLGGMGISIISTPQGVMTGKDAKNKGIGGEFLCEVW